MNEALAQAVRRCVQASILAWLLWLGQYVLGWTWLVYPALVALAYALICLLYAVLIWRNR